MRVDNIIKCQKFNCADTRRECYIVPDADIDPGTILAIMISETAPANTADYYYAPGTSLFQQTTIQAFQDAGIDVSSISDITDLGVYLTTAVKCGRTGYVIKSGTVEACSYLLSAELDLFPNARAFLLMGDVAIRSLNVIAGRAGCPRVIPAGPTYKIRGGEYYFKKARAFPSYLQAGPSFFIEKSKRRMIADDIKLAMTTINKTPGLS